MGVDGFKLFQIVSPFLHHPSAFRQILRIIVCRAYFILVAVGKLAFYPVPVVAKLIEQGGGYGAEAVNAHFVFLVAHAPESIEHGHIR